MLCVSAHHIVMAGVLLRLGVLPLWGQQQMVEPLDTMPEGATLQVCDDCGVEGRQPHIIAEGTHTYAASSAPGADLRARSVAWGWQQVTASYDDLDPGQAYVLAVLYGNEHFNARVQSLWAGDVLIHGPHALPRGGSERLLFRLPQELTADGALELAFRLEGPVNVVVSAVELWAAAPARKVLHVEQLTGLNADIQGLVTDVGYAGVADAQIVLRDADTGRELDRTRTEADGGFRFARAVLPPSPTAEGVEIIARHEGAEAKASLTPEDLYLAPVRYRPRARRQAGLPEAEISLDGLWRLCATTDDTVRTRDPSDASFGNCMVPGQWVQQGYDVPQDQPVAMVREFRVPSSWHGRRVFLRFDAIHAGTTYWLNGTRLGAGENLFTPVEWEITDVVRFGDTNRLDLEMVVDTLSEQLSYSSGYAFHSLGGIDRSVRVFALPQVHIRELAVTTDFDERYEDAELGVAVTLDNGSGRYASQVSVSLHLLAPDGTRVPLPDAKHSVRRLPDGETPLSLTVPVLAPAKWSAEKPSLYTLHVDLKQGETLLERIEQPVGFREIEVRGSQLYVNGARIKLAGACRHETHPLTGRADTARLAETDARLLKAANLNAVRTAHYPPTEEFLAACDRVGLYVEAEAPLCWVSERTDAQSLRAVLQATAATVAACRNHPSVITWSAANESQFSRVFDASLSYLRNLDPTRPTTFNWGDPEQAADLANLHYPPMPYDQHLPDDSRPIVLGEYFFPVCHEQTDVSINPGLRELWGHGHANPSSEYGRACAAALEGRGVWPGAPPGMWEHILASDRVVGGYIWAAFDEPFYLPDGRSVGYAWHHGFWGLIDGWRRPKPEWWLAKMIFSPVRFPERAVPLAPGQRSVSMPVENTYAFTDLSDLQFRWKLAGWSGAIEAAGSPGARVSLQVPLPDKVPQGTPLTIEVLGGDGELVTVAVITLGQPPSRRLPRPKAGPPTIREVDGHITVEGDAFGLVIDEASGALLPESSGCALTALPRPHFTRFDFGDLIGPSAKPYAVLPDAATRVVQSVEVRTTDRYAEIMVRETYEGLEGVLTWRIDREGVCDIAYDYTYTGAEELPVRERGLCLRLAPGHDTLTWDRWSEWGVFPEDCISRTQGTAYAHRDPKLGPAGHRVAPQWPWALDETPLGTNDFRSVRFHIYEAALLSAEGDGVRVYADADRHVRACLEEEGVALHILTDCPLAPIQLQSGASIAGSVRVRLLGGRTGRGGR